MSYLQTYIYGRPLSIICIVIIIAIMFWASVGYVCVKNDKKARLWKNLNILCLIGEIIVVLYATILTRQSINREVVLVPFYSFYEAIEQPEYYRSMLMNVFLFFPLGLTMPFALPNAWEKRVFISILFAIGYSSGIECMQYHFYLGRCEVDDILANSLGTVLGTLSYCILFLMTRKGCNKKKI